MSISGIGSHSGRPHAISAGGANKAVSSSFAEVFAATSPGTPQSDSAQETDFTNMTRKDLADWVNSRIKSGAMSLDGTESFVSMTAHMPVNGGLTALDDTEKVDFMRTAQDGMEWAQRHGEAASLRSLQAALDTMQRYQGKG